MCEKEEVGKRKACPGEAQRSSLEAEKGRGTAREEMEPWPAEV